VLTDDGAGSQLIVLINEGNEAHGGDRYVG
jgi:hypothetical protein